jgi:hypothetical protein
LEIAGGVSTWVLIMLSFLGSEIFEKYKNYEENNISFENVEKDGTWANSLRLFWLT